MRSLEEAAEAKRLYHRTNRTMLITDYLNLISPTTTKTTNQPTVEASSSKQKTNSHSRMLISDILNQKSGVQLPLIPVLKPTDDNAVRDDSQTNASFDKPNSQIDADSTSLPYVKCEPLVIDVDENLDERSSDSRGTICARCERCYISCFDSQSLQQQQQQQSQQQRPLGNKLNRMALDLSVPFSQQQDDQDFMVIYGDSI